VFSGILVQLSQEEFGDETEFQGESRYLKLAASTTGLAVLLEFTMLALNNLKRAVWALPCSAVKLIVVAAAMWVMVPCHGFKETDIINNWVVLGLSIIVMAYSYFIWVRFQRLAIHRVRQRYQAGPSTSFLCCWSGHRLTRMRRYTLKWPKSPPVSSAFLPATSLKTLFRKHWTAVLKVRTRACLVVCG
jgi:hypothetical protein